MAKKTSQITTENQNSGNEFTPDPTKEESIKTIFNITNPTPDEDHLQKVSGLDTWGAKNKKK